VNALFIQLSRAACLSLLLAQPLLAADTGGDADAGRRIYQSGRGASGEFVSAMIQGDVEISGEQLSCVACHQRSGLGSSEGGTQIPALLGSALFEPKEIRRRELANVVVHRPAYTRETLRTAITEGVDPTGRTLDPLMPRFQLDEDDLTDLVAYLEALAPVLAEGVTGDEIHFATIVDSAADPAEQAAMLDLMDAYFAGKRAETRLESKRATTSNWVKDWHYSGYRRWTLHVWTLNGPEETWPKQLEKYYEEQPVFAVISGISDRDWQPVHEFCEQTTLPCILPNTLSAPATAADSFYSLYFGEGTALEAGALVKYLQDSVPESATIVQIHGSDLAAISAADTVEALLPGRVINNFSLAPETVGRLPDYIAERSPTVVVAWLDDDALQSLPELPFDDEASLFLSSTLIRDLQTLPAGLAEQAMLLHPFQVDPFRKQSRRLKAWARTRDIEMDHLRIQANTFFALVLVGDAIQHIRSNYSREYLIEKMEHGAGRILVSSAYPNISLAPGQRYLQKGCYIVRVNDVGADDTDEPLWIVP
jgi:mono/diheme cytochrome c family protein